MGNIWEPDLSQIGIDASTLPEGWGWTTLDKDEEWTPGELLSRAPRYGEFVVAPYVTGRDACHHVFDATQLVVASVSGEFRDDYWLFPRDRWRKSLTPWAAAPHWWLFGPQGQEFINLTREAAGVGEDLWRQLDIIKALHSRDALREVSTLLSGPEPEVLNKVDRLMSAAHRKGAVARALHRASEMFYGNRVSEYDSTRFVTSSGLAPSRGSALYGVKEHLKAEVGAMDNAIRWLIMRDILPSDIYRMVAEPWQAVCKRPLHPADEF